MVRSQCCAGSEDANCRDDEHEHQEHEDPDVDGIDRQLLLLMAASLMFRCYQSLR